MILDLIKGKNTKAQRRLDLLINSTPKDPSILWYPSSGNDFRDLIELTPTRLLINKLPALPDLIVHNDYSFQGSLIRKDGILFEDKRTIVKVEQCHEMILTSGLDYEVNSSYIDFPENAAPKPIIYLLDIVINSKNLGEIRNSVLYFYFENINFLDEIILKNNIHISHLVKVREGCGFGGNRMSISIVYALLSEMRTKFLIIDNEEHTNKLIISNLKRKHNLKILNYELEKISSIPSWSLLRVSIFKIHPKSEEISAGLFDEKLRIIRTA